MRRSPQPDGSDFTEKYGLYGGMLFKICMVYLGSREDAEEAMQEAFIKLLYNSPYFNDDDHEKAWLIRITINKCKDMLRDVWRKRVVKTDEFDYYYDDPAETRIMDEIQKLPAKYKAVIHLRYFEEYSVRQISETLRINESAVKMRLKRGREILKIELEGEET